jgi:hypothetical protein
MVQTIWAFPLIEAAAFSAHTVQALATGRYPLQSLTQTSKIRHEAERLH